MKSDYDSKLPTDQPDDDLTGHIQPGPVEPKFEWGSLNLAAVPLAGLLILESPEPWDHTPEHREHPHLELAQSSSGPSQLYGRAGFSMESTASAATYLIDDPLTSSVRAYIDLIHKSTR
ncbi:MAG: hypothetical protein ACE5NW_07250 [Acidiferrobacterales bacterium]